MFGKGGTAYLRKLNLSGVDGEILRKNLELLASFDSLITEAEREIKHLMGNDPRVTLLRSVPGLGPILAVVVALEIDEITRFGAAPKLAAYAGLVPSTYASGGKVFHGHLLHMSNKWLRWAFVEAAWVAMRTFICYYEHCLFPGSLPSLPDQQKSQQVSDCSRKENELISQGQREHDRKDRGEHGEAAVHGPGPGDEAGRCAES
jgi:hypothetical protein